MSLEKMKDLFKRMVDDEDLKNQYDKDPVGTLQREGIDPDSLPPEMLEKVSGGSVHASESEVNFSVKAGYHVGKAGWNVANAARGGGAEGGEAEGGEAEGGETEGGEVEGGEVEGGVIEASML